MHRKFTCTCSESAVMLSDHKLILANHDESSRKKEILKKFTLPHGSYFRRFRNLLEGKPALFMSRFSCHRLRDRTAVDPYQNNQ
jgi:hypothetical protein